MLSFFSSNEPWRTYISNGNFLLRQLQPGAALQLSEHVSVTPAAVPHRAEFSNAVGFYIKVSDALVHIQVDDASWRAVYNCTVHACRSNGSTIICCVVVALLWAPRAPALAC